MLKSAYAGLNARPKVYLSKEYFCKMYPTCVSSKLCKFISLYFLFSFFLLLLFFFCLCAPPAADWCGLALPRLRAGGHTLRGEAKQISFHLPTKYILI